ncbi:hypothetical protein Egran_05676 [Elaphomyces granulatus]|uniref:DNA 3'-5' helicase n=1 Tax=Elaphomyces granulatus TaxID=519963 RepID=A0A232LRB4_9EURO|nr:hypothetical protein Egran_05676 [Elaphomyces granulatus]
MADILLPSNEDSDKDLLDLVNDTDSESSDSQDCSDPDDTVQQNLTGDDEGDNTWIFYRDNPQYLQVEKNMQISELRESQAQVLRLAGKSLIFQGLFHMQLDIGKSARSITIIFVPLSGLGQEQVTEINKRSRELGATEDTALFYDKTKVGDHHLEDIQRGRYKWVYMSPEKALHPDVMKSLWENMDFRSKVLLLAVDEAHLVSEWYVISIRFPAELDRPNLYYNIITTDMPAKYSGEGRSPLDFIMDELLPPGLQHLAHQIVQPYYADRSEKNKDLARSLFCAGLCRIICATEAFGMGMNIKDISRAYQVDVPRNIPQMMQRFGRAARDLRMRGICTMVLPKAFQGISAAENYQPKNKTQRALKWGPKAAIYTWLTASCLRRAFLEFLSAEKEYTAMSPGTCCSKCSELQRKSNKNLVFDAIGYEGLCDIEVEKGRSEAAKETRKELRKWKTPTKLQDMVLQELRLWKSRNLRNWPGCKGLFVPEMLVPEAILVKIAKNARRIACEDMQIRDIIEWGSYKKYRQNNAEDRVPQKM